MINMFSIFKMLAINNVGKKTYTHLERAPKFIYIFPAILMF